jgi:hypothetical protein
MTAKDLNFHLYTAAHSTDIDARPVLHILLFTPFVNPIKKCLELIVPNTYAAHDSLYKTGVSR